jgi:hypothetical protein
MEKDKFKIDRKAFSVVSLKEQEEEEKTYWWGKTPYERLCALETTRQMIYGYNPDTDRLQRVFEVVKRATGRLKDRNDLEHLQ